MSPKNENRLQNQEIETPKLVFKCPETAGDAKRKTVEFKQF